MKDGWQCPRCHVKWESNQEQPCGHLVDPVKISYMDPAEMIAKYGPPIKPLRKFQMSQNGEYMQLNTMRKKIHSDSNKKGESR